MSRKKDLHHAVSNSESVTVSDLILSLDIGTSSTRASLYDADTLVSLPDGFRALKHTPTMTPDGGASLDPESLVGEALACMGAVLEQARGRTIRAVGVCTFWHSALGVDEQGMPLTPILLWSDRRAGAQVKQLKNSLDPERYTDRTGCPLHTSYLPARLIYLRDTQPDLWSTCRRFVSPGEYLLSRLFGTPNVTCSASMASGTGLYDARTEQWDAETLDRVGLKSEQLSPVGDMPQQGLSSEFRSHLAPLADVPFFPALGDGACSNVGCGAAVTGRIALMVGTSGALRAASEENDAPPVPPGLWRYQIGPQRFLLGGALSNGGSVWAWLRRTLPLSADDDAIENALAGLKPDSHGLTVLPFLAGERAPLWRDDLRSTIHGLDEATTPADIARAYLEAVALRFAGLRDALRPVAGASQIVGTGAGLLASKVWAQIICDAIGEPISLSSEEQASSRGAALWGRQQTGGPPLSDAPPVPVTEVLYPDPEHTKIYTAARERQEDLLRRLW